MNKREAYAVLNEYRKWTHRNWRQNQHIKGFVRTRREEQNGSNRNSGTGDSAVLAVRSQ